MAKKDVSPEELVETHKPKFVKYKYIFTDESLLTELLQLKYDMTTLDTIGNDELVNTALEASFTEYDRTVVGKSTAPSFLDNGIIISKRLITKADKKLLKVSVGRFMFNGSQFVAIKFTYERFEIVEVFNLI